MKLTESKLRRLLRDILLEIDEGACAKLVFGETPDEDENPDLLAEPASEYLEDAREEEQEDKKPSSKVNFFDNEKNQEYNIQRLEKKLEIEILELKKKQKILVFIFYIVIIIFLSSFILALELNLI